MRRPLPIALGCAFAAALVYGIALHTTAGGHADAAVLDAFARLRAGWLDGLATDLVRFLDPAPYLLLGAALVAIALARGLPRHAVVVVGVLGGAALTSQLLKPALAVARPWETWSASEIVGGSWPSGHTTAAVALALCVTLVVPGRPARIAAAAFAIAVAGCLVLLGTHWPSDVLGGACVAVAWFALGVAALPYVRVPAVSPRAVRALVLAGAGAVLVAAAARPDGTASFVQNHTTVTAAAGLLAAACAVLLLQRPRVPRRG